MKVGDHLVSPRIGYSHHGIYIGDGQVIHYSGFANGISSGEIEIASLDEFSRGNDINIKEHWIRTYDENESVSRAFSRLGEDWYNVLLNNCEHFVTWCIIGIHSSAQVNSLIGNVASATAAKSMASSSAGTVAGLAAGTSLVSGTGATTAIVAGLTATPAAPLVVPVAVAVGVGYSVKKIIDWIWD